MDKWKSTLICKKGHGCKWTRETITLRHKLKQSNSTFISFIIWISFLNIMWNQPHLLTDKLAKLFKYVISMGNGNVNFDIARFCRLIAGWNIWPSMTPYKTLLDVSVSTKEKKRYDKHFILIKLPCTCNHENVFSTIRSFSFCKYL